MITSTPLSRNLFTQDDTFSFLFSTSLPDTTGLLDFGFLCQSGSQNYRFVNGRVLDNEFRFIGTYQANKTFNLSGVVTPTQHDVYLNGQAKAFALPRSGGNVTGVYVKPPSGVSLNFNLYIQGKTPQYTAPSLVTFQTGTNIPVTGYLTNLSSYPIFISSGQYNGNSNFKLSGFDNNVVSSGRIVMLSNGATAGGYQSLPLTFYTNFGTISFSMPISGIVVTPPSYYVYLNGPSIASNSYSPMIYRCQFGDPVNGLAVTPILQYSSGNVVNYNLIPGTGYFSGNLTGLISGSGFAYSAPLTTTLTGAGGATGSFSGRVGNLYFVSGNQTYTTNVLYSGMASGDGYTGLASFINQVTLHLPFVSGVALATGTYTNYADPVSSTSPHYQNASASLFIVSPTQGDLVYVGDPHYALSYPYDFNSSTGLATILNDHTGRHKVFATASGSQVLLTSIYSGESGNGLPLIIDNCNKGSLSFSSSILTGGATAYYTGLHLFNNGTGSLNQYVTGVLYMNPVYTGNVTGSISGIASQKVFSGLWNVYTGQTSAFSSMVQLPYDQNSQSFIGQSISGASQSFYLAIDYDNLFDGNNDFATLKISGNNLILASINLTGVPE